jgi:histidinol-phosphatase (PHP family)
LLTSYHVHTSRSDGAAGMPDFVAAAIDMKLDELGFSDHYTLVPSGDTPEWSMAPDELPAYLDEIASTADSVRGRLVVRRGLEVDYVPARIKDVADQLATYRLDYVIGSIHFVNGFPIDAVAERWEEISATERDEVFREYWSLMRGLADSRLFDIVGHVDVVRKFDYWPSFDIAPLVLEALDAIARAGMIVEMNTSGWHTPSRKAYPEPWILKECVSRNTPVMISADAHKPDNLTRDFDRAREDLSRLGSSGYIVFEDRRPTIMK